MHSLDADCGYQTRKCIMVLADMKMLSYVLKLPVYFKYNKIRNAF